MNETNYNCKSEYVKSLGFYLKHFTWSLRKDTIIFCDKYNPDTQFALYINPEIQKELNKYR